MPYQTNRRNIEMSWKTDTCSICFDFLEDPCQLPCSHVFCHSCLEKFFIELAQSTDSVPRLFDCPNCRASLPAPQHVPLTKWACKYSLLSFSYSDRNKSCTPCTYDCRDIIATRYCMNCREYLCEDCYFVHKKLSISRDHNVSLHRSTSEKMMTKSERCSCGWKQKLEFYCDDHDEICCGKCVVQSHRQCTLLTTVAGRSDCLRQTGEVDQELEKWDTMCNQFQELVTLSEANKDYVETARDKVVQSIQDCQGHLQRLLSETDAAIRKVNDVCDDAFQYLEKRIQRSRDAVQKIKNSSIANALRTASRENDNDQLFVYYKRYCHDLPEYKELLCQRMVETKTLGFYWTQNETLQMLENVRSIESIEARITTGVFSPELYQNRPLVERNATQIKITHLPSADYNISSLVELTDGKIIVVDATYGRVSLLDKDIGKWIASTDISGAWDITLIGGGQVVVTCGDNAIYFLTASDLKHVKTWNTDTQIWGITFCSRTEEVILATGDPPAVQVLSLETGKEFTLHEDANGQKLLHNRPSFVAVDDEGDVFYVSDEQRGVIAVQRDGEVKFRYSGLRYANGISVDEDGNIYVCGTASHEIHQISSEGNLVQVISGVPQPFGLFYNSMNDTLVLSHEEESTSCDLLTHYQLQ